MAALQALAFGAVGALLGVDLGEGVEVIVGVGDGVFCASNSSTGVAEHPVSDNDRKSTVANRCADTKCFFLETII